MLLSLYGYYRALCAQEQGTLGNTGRRTLVTTLAYTIRASPVGNHVTLQVTLGPELSW